MFCGFRKSFRQSEMDKVTAYTEYNWNRLERLISNLYLQQEAIIRLRNGYSKHRQRAAAGLPTFTNILSNLVGNYNDRCYGRDRGGNQGRIKASERCALC